jgi:hypothetical protein
MSWLNNLDAKLSKVVNVMDANLSQPLNRTLTFEVFEDSKPSAMTAKVPTTTIVAPRPEQPLAQPARREPTLRTGQAGC